VISSTPYLTRLAVGTCMLNLGQFLRLNPIGFFRMRGFPHHLKLNWSRFASLSDTDPLRR
jgi:hypothetical protein